MNEARITLAALAATLIGLSARAQDAPELTPRPGEPDPAALEERSAASETAAAELAREAARINRDIDRLQAELVDAAREMTAAERDAVAADARLAALAREERIQRLRVEADRERLGEILAVLQRISRAAPPALAAAPDDAAGAARAAGLLAETAPALRERAARARAEIDRLHGLQEAIAVEREAFDARMLALNSRRDSLLELISQRQSLEARLRGEANEEAERAAALAAEAQSLRDLVAALRAAEAERTPRPEPPRAEIEAEPATPMIRPRPDPETALQRQPAVQFDTTRFADARGTLAIPAAGAITSGFGERGRVWPAEGLVVQTLSRAQVLSPYDAQILFAGPLGNYEVLLLLDVGDGYHIVLAGLSSAYGATGQSVLAGEPIGEMPDRGDPPPELYIEFQRDGEPFDPRPWLRG